MPTKKQVFCYFWIKVIDEAAQIREDADRLARAARATSGGARFDTTVIVDPTTSDRVREPVIVDPSTSDRIREPVIVDPSTSDRAGGAVTQWTQDTSGATSISISAVPQGHVVADASVAYTTKCITLSHTFNEESARKWIETEEGRRWRGHAKVCVLHHVVVTIGP